MSSGFLYIASGQEFVLEAELSADSVKSAMPELPITIISDSDVEAILGQDHPFDDIIGIDNPVFEFGDPVLNMHRLPYGKTIYLDTDIHLEDSIAEVFELLERFDVAAAHDPYWCAPEHFDEELLYDVPRSFPQYNGGVLGLKDNPMVQDFIDRWQELYQNETAQDPPHQNQPTLRKALYESGLRIATLTSQYNCRVHVPGYAVGKVKVFHGRLHNIDTPGVPYDYDMDDVVKEINKSSQPRVFIQLPGLDLAVVERHSLDSIGYLLFSSLVNNGVTQSLAKAFDFGLRKANLR